MIWACEALTDHHTSGLSDPTCDRPFGFLGVGVASAKCGQHIGCFSCDSQCYLLGGLRADVGLRGLILAGGGLARLAGSPDIGTTSTRRLRPSFIMGNQV